LKILPYIAAVIFGGMFVAAMDVSSTLSYMQDTGFNLYHDQVDVIVNWFESKACMVLPPVGYVTNCVYIGSITAVVVLTVLLAAVLVMLMILRRHEKGR
jgi:Fe2+ transport system protein B